MVGVFEQRSRARFDVIAPRDFRRPPATISRTFEAAFDLGFRPVMWIRGQGIAKRTEGDVLMICRLDGTFTARLWMLALQQLPLRAQWLSQLCSSALDRTYWRAYPTWDDSLRDYRHHFPYQREHDKSDQATRSRALLHREADRVLLVQWFRHARGV